MNLLVLEVPIPEVNNKLLKKSVKFLNYTILLDNARLTDYNQSTYLPAKTITLNPASELLQLDWDSEEFNLMFTQKQVKEKFDALKFQKKVKTGLLAKHELIDQVLERTPIHLDRDSIKQSLWLIELNKKVMALEEVVPSELLNPYIKVRKSVERVQPIKDLNLAKLDNGLAYQGTKSLEVKQGLRIKNHPDKACYEFNNGFYTLGGLAKISLELENIWNH